MDESKMIEEEILRGINEEEEEDEAPVKKEVVRCPLHAWRYGTNKKWESEMECEVEIMADKVVVMKQGVVLQVMQRTNLTEIVDYFVTGRLLLVGKQESLFICVDAKHGSTIRGSLAKIFLKNDIRKVDYQQFFTLQKVLHFPLSPVEEPSSFVLNEEGEALAALQKQLRDLQFLNKGMDRMVKMLEETSSAAEQHPLTYAILHEDGDLDEAVPMNLIRLAPERPGNWGKAPRRGHTMLPENCGDPGVGLHIGALVVARWTLYHGDKDIRGSDIDAWFAGTIVSLPSRTGRVKLSHKRKQHQPNYELVGDEPEPVVGEPYFLGKQPLPSPLPVTQHWSVMHEDGDFDEFVPPTRIRLCPTRPSDWGKCKHNRGPTKLPPNCGEPGYGLYHGAKVVSKWSEYKGKDDDSWFAGTLISPQKVFRKGVQPVK